MFNAPIILASWVLVGPPFPIFISLLIGFVGLISILRCRYTQKTIALLGLMGLMVIQCIVIVLILHLQLWQPVTHPGLRESATWLGQELFGLDFRLAEVGIPAAIFAGAYIEFVRSRFNLSLAFPSLAAYDQTDDLAVTVQKLAASANIECPNLCLVDTGAPCAFTVRARRKYTIALSVGLLESFDRKEVEACIAHEIGHIKNRDFALRTLATIARIALFAKVMSYFIEAALYRTRELLADRTAAALVGGPAPLISALTKLQEASCVDAVRPAAHAICFFDATKSVFELLSKHPKLSTRIRMLREMDQSQKTSEKLSGSQCGG